MARPLEKTNDDGPLIRSSEIEAEIDTARGQDLETLRHRAVISDPKAPDYLRSETLVHLIRHGLRQSNAEATHNQVANRLLPLLLKRCERNLQRKVDAKLPDAETLREEILRDFSMLFADELVGEGGLKLDFYEIRFNMAFASFRIDAVRAHVRRENHRATLAPGRRDDIDDNTAQRAFTEEDIADPGPDLENLITRRQLTKKLHAAVLTLPEADRKALILRYFYGYKIESPTNPEETTVATLCNVSGRVIGKRLKRALETLRSMLREAT